MVQGPVNRSVRGVSVVSHTSVFEARQRNPAVDLDAFALNIAGSGSGDETSLLSLELTWKWSSRLRISWSSFRGHPRNHVTSESK